MEAHTPPEPVLQTAIRIDSHLGGAHERSLADDVLDGLTRPFKELPAKHFYDARGAELFDLPIPRMEPGATADVVLVDLGAEWTVGESGYHSRSEHCAFDGRTVRGEILLTLAGGAIAHRAGAPNEVAA